MFNFCQFIIDDIIEDRIEETKRFVDSEQEPFIMFEPAQNAKLSDNPEVEIQLWVVRPPIDQGFEHHCLRIKAIDLIFVKEWVFINEDVATRHQKVGLAH